MAKSLEAVGVSKLPQREAKPGDYFLLKVFPKSHYWLLRPTDDPACRPSGLKLPLYNSAGEYSTSFLAEGDKFVYLGIHTLNLAGPAVVAGFLVGDVVGYILPTFFDALLNDDCIQLLSADDSEITSE